MKKDFENWHSIDSKKLIRKIETLEEDEFIKLKIAMQKVLFN